MSDTTIILRMLQDRIASDQSGPVAQKLERTFEVAKKDRDLAREAFEKAEGLAADPERDWPLDPEYLEEAETQYRMKQDAVSEAYSKLEGFHMGLSHVQSMIEKIIKYGK